MRFRVSWFQTGESQRTKWAAVVLVGRVQSIPLYGKQSTAHTTHWLICNRVQGKSWETIRLGTQNLIFPAVSDGTNWAVANLSPRFRA